MASEQLREAIIAECDYEAETPGGEIISDMILSEFVVVAARQSWDSDGEPVTQVVVIPYDGAPHRILGLLRTAVLRMEADDLEANR